MLQQIKAPLPSGGARAMTSVRIQMKISQIVVGFQFTLLAALTLGLIGKTRKDIQWSALGETYRESAKLADVEWPQSVDILWPFAPVAWWSWITPIALGVFVAARLRRALDLSTLILSSLGTVTLIVVVLTVLLTYSKPFQYMGHPPVVPIDSSSMIGNLVLIALSVGFAVKAILAQRSEQGDAAGEGETLL